MNCVGIFVTPTSVVLAVYFAVYCEPCITQEKYKFQYIIFVFALNPRLNSLPHFCVLFIYVVLLTEDVFQKNFQQHFFHDTYFIYFVKLLKMNTLCSAAYSSHTHY